MSKISEVRSSPLVSNGHFERHILDTCRFELRQLASQIVNTTLAGHLGTHQRRDYDEIAEEMGIQPSCSSEVKEGVAVQASRLHPNKARVSE